MSYYPANNNLQMPLAYSQYPSLSVQQPTASTQSSAPLSSQLFITDAQQSGTGTTPVNQTYYQRVKSAITVRRVAKTVVAVTLVVAVLSFLGNAYHSTIPPDVSVKSVSAFCSASSPCSVGSPLSLFVNLEVGSYDTHGDWNFDVAVFLPQNITVDYTATIAYQHLGQGRLISRTQSTLQDLTATTSTIQQLRDVSIITLESSSSYERMESNIMGIIQLPASSQTDTVINNMNRNGVSGTPVFIEVSTHIHQWFKDLQFVTQATVPVIRPVINA